MKKIILAIIIGILLLGCGKAKPPVRPLYYDKSKTVAPMKDGKLHGMRKAYRGNGSIIALTPYKNGEKDGIEKTYNQYGKLVSEISYKKDKKDGLCKKWNFSRKTSLDYSITPYKNGKIDGTVIKYFSNGKIRIKTPYLNDKREGVSKSWDKNGAQSRITPFKNNKIEGIVKRFENGHLIYIGAYSKGKQYGIHKSYSHLNGKIQEAVPYVNGKLEGRGKIYDENGSLKYTLVWVDGVEGKTTYSAKEKKRRAKAQKKSAKRAKTQAIQLRCGWEDSHPSMSEVSHKTAIAKGKGEGAALGFQIKNKTVSTSKLEANNYCTQNANAEALSCTYAKAYLWGCMSKFGY